LSPYELHLSVRNKISEINKIGKVIDYIAFKGSGEPALDTSLAQEIIILRDFGYKIAVFTNASLIWNEHIQENLMFADYVSVKIDTVNPDTWLKINRPHERLRYDLILDGIRQFSKKFKGKFLTETMLIRDINDNYKEIEELGNYLNTINREASYFTSPVFPPGNSCTVCPESENLESIKNLIKEKVSKPVLLCCPDEEEFTPTDDFENELLGLIAIHPVGTEAVKHYIKNEEDRDKLKEIIEKQIIREVVFQGKSYYAENIAS
jgi:wyosine [tRNA(Phe)-imidazoG37] synthetase (radical SAM superfamily)